MKQKMFTWFPPDFVGFTTAHVDQYGYYHNHVWTNRLKSVCTGCDEVANNHCG